MRIEDAEEEIDLGLLSKSTTSSGIATAIFFSFLFSPNGRTVTF